jgi:transposase
VIGLYLNPPRHAVVFAADEKTAIQALDRLDPALPLSPGRIERHGFEYFRHGSLYAALNTKTGEIIGQTVPRHTSAPFVEFLGDIVTTHPRREIHVIVDNLSAHKTKGCRRSWTRIPGSTCTSRPPKASWLNQVELWFGKIERDLLAAGSHHATPPRDHRATTPAVPGRTRAPRRAASTRIPRRSHRYRARVRFSAWLSAQQIAAHASPKTTKLYDRTADTISLDEIERIVI